MTEVVAVIPARYASTRFPGKPLALIQGKAMIEHVYRRVVAAESVNRVIVATDDERIAEVVSNFGGEVMLTRTDHPTGTDRLAEVAWQLSAELVVNVQGDEPLIDPRMIDQAVTPLLRDSSLHMGTLATEIKLLDDFYDPNVVKVVRDRNGQALYFSRGPIPWPRDLTREQLASILPCPEFLRHIGLYVYRRDLLLAYPQWPKTPLEKLENLEQLRALEQGIRLHVELTDADCHGVDTPADLDRISRMIS